MKKLITAGLLSLPIVLVAAIALTTSHLNSAFVEAFESFQSNDSKIGVNFTELNSSLTSIEKLKLNAWLLRKSPHNTFDFQLKSFEYNFGNETPTGTDSATGTQPSLKFDSELKLDFVKALGRDEVNAMAESLEDMVQTYSEEYLEKYGAAAVVSSKIINSSKNSEGHYESITAVFKLNLDYKKLPADISIDEVELQNAEITISMTTTSVSTSGDVVFNPQYFGFDSQTSGLKEELEKLTNRDKQTLSDLQNIVNTLLYFIDEIISQDKSL